MSESASNSESVTSTPAANMRAMLRMVLLDVGLAVIVYYGLRLFGMSEYIALLAGTIVAGVRLAYVAARRRHFDVFAGFLMTVFLVGLVLSFVTGDARFLLLKESFGTAVAGIIFLASCAFGRPLIFAAAKRLRPERVAVFDANWRTNAPFRRTFYLLSIGWGAGLLAEAIVRVPLVFLLPIDVAAGVSSVLFIGVMILLAIWTLSYIRRARRPDASTSSALPISSDQSEKPING